jgi:hypothetical protein
MVNIRTSDPSGAVIRHSRAGGPEPLRVRDVGGGFRFADGPQPLKFKFVGADIGSSPVRPMAAGARTWASYWQAPQVRQIIILGGIVAVAAVWLNREGRDRT